MVLTAGLSTRMRPLTEKLPKILLPVLGKTHLDRTLDYLQTQNIQQVSMNLFHGKEILKKEIQNLNRLPTDPAIFTFDESPIRGTGGGILGMKTFVSTDHFAILNCDFLTDLDLQKMFEFHVQNQALATLFLAPLPPKTKYGKVSFDKNQGIESFNAKNSNHFFGGIHILSKEIFDHFPNDHEFCIIRNVYEPLIQKGAKILGYTDKCRWLDVGELRLYHQSLFETLKKPFAWMKDVQPSSSWIHESVEIFGDVTSKNVIIEKYAIIPERTLLVDTVVFPTTRVKPGDYERMILTPDHRVKI